jgi:serine/threonine protein phosphatase PrpC
MSDLVHPVVRESRHGELRALPERIPLLSLLRKDLASNRPTWLPLVLVLAAIAGDVLVFYTDGVTEAENQLGEEFGIQRLSSIVQRGSSRSAEELMNDIFNSASDFCSEVGFEDDVTILVVECGFDGSPSAAS